MDDLVLVASTILIRRRSFDVYGTCVDTDSGEICPRTLIVILSIKFHKIFTLISELRLWFLHRSGFDFAIIFSILLLVVAKNPSITYYSLRPPE